jgi:hypothetical protein
VIELKRNVNTFGGRNMSSSLEQDKKEVQIATRVDRETFELIAGLAEKEHRSISNMVLVMVKEYLTGRFGE